MGTAPSPSRHRPPSSPRSLSLYLSICMDLSAAPADFFTFIDVLEDAVEQVEVSNSGFSWRIQFLIYFDSICHPPFHFFLFV